MKYDAVKFLSDLFPTRPPRLIDSLSAYWRDIYDERAGIKQYCGEMSRELAETQALAETIQHMQSGDNAKV